MTYTGYARRRGSGFQSTSGPASRRIKQIESNVTSSLEDDTLAAKRRKENQKASLDALRAQFNQDQETRLELYNLEIEQSQIRRNLGEQTYNSEIRAIEAESAEQTKIFDSISSLSETATTYLQEQAKERKDLEIKTGEGLIIKYGLTPNEIKDIQELEQANKDFGQNTSDVINKLRQMGAPESDIQTLQSMSGYIREGAVQRSIINAADDYSGYLSRNADKEFLFGDQVISLSDAERNQSPEAQDLALDLLRTDFIEEYLPGIAPEYIARHAKDKLSATEAVRKLSLERNVETSSATLNALDEKDQIINAAKGVDTINNTQAFHDLYQQDPLGRARYTGHLIELIGDGAISAEYGRLILNGNVDDKRFPEPVPFYESSPALAQQIENAIDKQEGDRRQARNQVISDANYQAATLYTDIERQVRNAALSDGNPLTEAEAREAMALLDSIPGLVGNEYQKKIKSLQDVYGPNQLNTKLFNENWNDLYRRGIYPTIYEIKSAGLTPEAERTWMERSVEAETPGVSQDRLDLFKKSAERELTKVLGSKYSDKSKVKPSTFGYALDYAITTYVNDYRNKLAETNDPIKAEEYARGNFAAEIKLGDNGQYRISDSEQRKDTTAVLDPTFKAFEAVATNLTTTKPPTFLSNEIPKIIENNQLIKEKAYVTSNDLEAYINRINNGEPAQMPQAIRDIAKGTNISPFDVLKDQIEVIRRTNPNLPELQLDKNPDQVLNEIDPQMRAIFDRHKYDPNLIDRAVVYGTGGPVYDQDDPYYSVTSLLNSFGVTDREDLITWAAIMMGESSGRPAPPDYRGADPTRPTEKSRGLFQINLDSPGRYELLERLGVTPQQLYDPVKNITVALEIYKSQGFGAWGAYTNGSYKTFIPEATRAVDQFLNSQSVPTYERTQNMNPRALRLTATN